MQKIKNKSAKVAVVGVGYVGLPVAALCAKAGYDATGVDVNEKRVKLLNRGGNPIEGKEPGLNDLLKQARATGRLHFTSSADIYRDSDIIIIAVETPVESDHKPKYKALRAALEAVAKQVASGKWQVAGAEVMVIVESTVAPGTVDKIVRPTLEEATGRKEGRDLYVVHCPERLMPGQLIKKILHHSRVIGAASPYAANIAKTFYRHIIVHQPKNPDFQWRGELDVASNIEAEIVKTAENAYRDVQIAFANELAQICEEYGADFWRVRELVRKSPRRDVHEAGVGVGGHCLPKDSWLLLANSHRQRQHSVIADARRFNDLVPKHVFEIVKLAAKENNISLKKINIAVMGFSYLENSDDTRNSPTSMLLSHLDRDGIKYKIHDPFVPEYKTKSLSSILSKLNMALFMVAHSQYRALRLSNIAKQLKSPKIIIDGRNIFKRDSVQKAGMKYYGIGDVSRQ